MATTPKEGSFFDQMSKRVQYGMDHGGTMGAMMGFLGLPYLARGGGSDSAPHGSGPAPFQRMWPGGIAPGNGGAPGTGGDGPAVDPNDPNGDPNDPNNPNSGRFAWSFPQYSQSWAFTPPAPTPYSYPQPFDPKKYGDPFAKGSKK